MASEISVNQLLERNRAVAESHVPIPILSEFKSLGMHPPHILVLTCVDPRCSPEYYLNLKPGDGVIVARNVCGHVAPALNDMIALDRLVTLKEILIVHHTDCGSLLWKDSDIREDLKKIAPNVQAIDNMDFGGITDVEQSVKDDLAILTSSPFIRKELADNSSGYVYDLKTGKLSPVQM